MEKKKLVLIIASGILLISSLIGGIILVKRRQETRRGAVGGNNPICPLPRSWGEFRFNRICEKVGEPNGKDALTEGAGIGYCQMMQDDRGPSNYKHYFKGPEGETFDCTCCPGCDGYTNKLKEWDWAKCVKCKNLDVTWKQDGQRVIIDSVRAKNWWLSMDFSCTDKGRSCGRRKESKCSSGAWEYTTLVNADERIEFKFEVYEAGSSNPIARQISQASCSYNGDPECYVPRDQGNHYSQCTVSNQVIEGIDFEPGKTYKLKAWVRNATLIERLKPGDCPKCGDGWRLYSVCEDTFTPTEGPTETPTPTPTETPTPTPTETPAPNCQCSDLQMYSLNWVLITDYTTLEPGDEVYLAVRGTAGTDYDLEKARFKVNGRPWNESTQRHDDYGFYINWTVSDYGDYLIEAEVYHPACGWK